MNKFELAYKKLNQAQKVAVDLIDGPVMVMAGPGTGKTHVLSTRIANILLKQDVQPANILALTFTDAAAKNMRQRVVDLIGSDGYYVSISTFHSFASEVIASYPDLFPIERGSQPLSELEKYQIFEKIILDTNLKILKPINSPLYYLNEVISQISKLKRENVNPEKFERIVDSEESMLENEMDELSKSEKLKRQKSLEKQKELYLLFVKYESELRNNRRFDFDDMISLVVEILGKEKEVLLDYQEKFQYILVDEYQDTNSAQNEIISLLASHWKDNPNVFVVGDPHQSIFRFQGASIENMVGFIKNYPNSTLITLETGYRCGQDIYDSAHQLISNNELGIQISGGSLDQASDKKINNSLSTRLKSSKARSNKKINLFEADSQALEMISVVEKIRKLIADGVEPEEIAVIFRNNSDSLEIAELLDYRDISYESTFGGNALNDKYVIQLINLFKLIEEIKNNNETDLIFEVMMYDWLGLDKLAVMQVTRLASKKRIGVFDVLSMDFKNLNEESSISQASFQELVDFRDKLILWQQKNNNILFNEWFSLVIADGFGLMDFLMKRPAKVQHLLAINTIYSLIKENISSNISFKLSNFLFNIDLMNQNKMVLENIDFGSKKGRVVLTTAHKAKGQEWKHVFIINCIDKKWGNNRNRKLIPLPDSILTNTDISKKEKNEDERRLFYVALTRASEQVHLSFPKTKNVNGKIKDMVGSMFIEEIKDGVTLSNQSIDQDLLKEYQEIFLNSVAKKTTTESIFEAKTKLERDFFKKLVDNFVLSVTALNNYLKDEQEFVRNSLLRVPRAKSPILSFGTAVHYALEQLYKKFKEDEEMPSEIEVINNFENGLRRENLQRNDFEERLKRGNEVLSFYYAGLKDKIRKPLMTEKFFGGPFNRISVVDGEDEIKLSGRVDRIDLIAGSKDEIRIIDYKTGKPKSNGYIDGSSYTDDYSPRELLLPENIRGRYKRQLVFYKLLADLDKSFKYKVAQASFDFVEPFVSASGEEKHIVRSFTITQKDVDDLVIEIKKVMSEIRNLEFLRN